MRPIATNDPVVRGVSVCPSCGYAVQKRLNGSRSCVGWRLLGTQGTLCKIRVPTASGEESGEKCFSPSMRPSPNYLGLSFTGARLEKQCHVAWQFTSLVNRHNNDSETDNITDRSIMTSRCFAVASRDKITSTHIYSTYSHCTLYIATCKWPMALCCLIN